LPAPGLRDVSVRENTFVKAETCWPALTKLKPGEIYVSEVIGAYVPTQWIGPCTKARAEELEKPFAPEASGYASLENPVGKRKPAPESSKSGSVALDCRYLNFSPQCHGWDALTEHGGSGSFAIFFSGLWKRTTAATIPYYPAPTPKANAGLVMTT